MAAMKKSYPVLSLIRMGGKDHAAGGTIDLTETEFEGLRASGAIGIEPAPAGENSSGASPAQTSAAPSGEAGATVLPARGGEDGASRPSGEQASKDGGAGSGESAPPSVSRAERIKAAASELQAANKKVTVANVERIVGFDVTRAEIDAALAPSA